MLKALLVIFILFDLTALIGRNLALRSFHLNNTQQAELAEFNRIAGLSLFLLLLLLLFLLINPAKKSPHDTWPKTPPQ